jgi:predicted nucleic acid-binding protein
VHLCPTGCRGVKSCLLCELPLDSADVPRMRALLRKYSDRPMDLADAALVRVGERDGLHTVLTTDRRDFSVYRLHGSKRFRLIL